MSGSTKQPSEKARRVVVFLAPPVEALLRARARAIGEASGVAPPPGALAKALLHSAMGLDQWGAPAEGVTPERLAWARLAIAAGEDDKEAGNAAARDLAAMGVPVAELRKRART